MERLTYRNQSTKSLPVVGATSNFGEINYIPVSAGRAFTDFEVERRRYVVMLGNAPAQTLFPGADPSARASASARTSTPWSACSASALACWAATPTSSPSCRSPPTTSCSQRRASGGISCSFLQIMAAPREGATQRAADPGDRGRIAGTPPPAAGRGERLRPAHGRLDPRHPQPVHPRHPARADRDLVDRADGRRHRRDGHHDHLGDGAHARDRRPQGPRRQAARDPRASSSSRRSSSRRSAASSACCSAARSATG